MRFRDEIPTPALLLDLEAFESNVAAMAGFLRERGRAFRPHGKTHKCPEIARRLIQAGAVGCGAARLSEAEVFAEHGVRGLLVTTAVIGVEKIARAAALAARASDTIFCVDHAQNVRDLNDAAAARGGAHPRLRLAVDLFFGRTGVTPGEPARDLARLIASLPHLEFAGLQAYDGTAAHTTPFDARAARTRGTMALAVETRRLIEGGGLPCPLVTGGSTGTYRIDSAIDGITELQPGSFIFMDIDYGRIGGSDGGAQYRDFRNALTVATTVVSAPPGMAIVDGGYKAFSTDRPFTPAPLNLPGATYAWAGDEHGRLEGAGASGVKVGDRVEFIPPHCDPTVNLYDAIHVVRGDRVEAVWPIAARGRSQ